MTKLAKEATRPSDRRIVEALEWVAANDGRVIFADGWIGVTVGVHHKNAEEVLGFVRLVEDVRDQFEEGTASGS